MSIRHWTNLRESERVAYRASIAFLNGRLEERATIDWALRLKSSDTINRYALLALIEGPEGLKLKEPWKSAWRTIEESWEKLSVEDHSLSEVGIHKVQQRLLGGEKSGSLITAIVELVEPRLKVEPFSGLHWLSGKPPMRPKKVSDLISTSLNSKRIVDPEKLGLTDIRDRNFLTTLGVALDAAVVKGLEIARRIGGERKHSFWRLGQLHRVYYVPTADRNGEHEPDEFNRGIVPAVKLLHEVVSRLVEIEVSTAISFIQRWKIIESPVHLRLWAALSRDPRVTPADEVSAWLLALDDRPFWSLNSFPEISELRAKRFDEFNSHDQVALLTRIRKCPPRNQWPKSVPVDRLKRARIYSAARELRRIEIAGGHLPKRYKKWLDVNVINFEALHHMSRIDEGFLDAPIATWVPPNPDSQYDMLEGEERLIALENALSLEHDGWEDDPAKRAIDWIKLPENPIKIIVDFEAIPDGGASFVRVWEQFGWIHSPLKDQGDEVLKRDLSAESARVESLLAKLPNATIRKAIHGISNWLSAWEKHIDILSEKSNVWFKLWPIAVEDTNSEHSVEEEIHLNTVVEDSNDQEPMDLDTLNTPVGKLVGVFLTACPNLDEIDRPFDVDGPLRRMRDAVSIANGRSRLIALYRIVESLPYFLNADPEWTREYLIEPLKGDSEEARALWRAIARRTHSSKVLKIIGSDAAERATDRRLGRETRRSLVFSLVVDCLYTFLEQREAAVPFARIQQMIRSLDDEVRAYGAWAVHKFVHDLTGFRKGNNAPLEAKELFQSAGAPFLKRVWPQERSLSTPGVSQALAELPALAPVVFAEVVETIERFLVPFECWSMIEYGLYGDMEGKPKLSIIDDNIKAAAFLKLLHLTIGTAEGSVIPVDLSDALDQIRNVAPTLSESREFRRLATLARRL